MDNTEREISKRYVFTHGGVILMDSLTFGSIA